MSTHDPTTRFSNRVDAYVRYRPSYPADTVDWILQTAGVRPGAVIADVGSGTGIFTSLLLERGMRVIAIEPNHAMRLAAEDQLAHHPEFVSLDGTAEALPVADQSVDLITCAQAFHWFDLEKARAEFSRVLKPNSKTALIWNDRQTQKTEFLRAYEALLVQHGTDYRQVDHKQFGKDQFERFFAGAWSESCFENAQHLDIEGLRGRVESSSYTPQADSPGYPPMIRALQELFDQHARDGQVTLGYDTTVFLGPVHR